jgi:hypothetical protein
VLCPSQSSTEELCSIAHPRDGHPKVLVMLDAYFDESGIHAGAPVLIVAGYYAPPDAWKQFESAWKAVLDSEAIEEFHAKVFFGGGSPFRKWKKKRREEFLYRLLDAIVESDVHAVGAALVMTDWKRLDLDHRRFMTGAKYLPRQNRFVTSGSPKKPYFVPFQDCIARVATLCEEDEKAHYFFSLNKQFHGYALDVYRLIKTHPMPFEKHLGMISFPTPKDLVHLQAADLLCYLLHDFLPRRLKDADLPVPEPLARAMERRRSIRDFSIYHLADKHPSFASVERPRNWYLDRGHLE